MKLLLSKKNSLFDLIESHDLSPSIFGFQEIKDDDSEQIKSRIYLKSHSFNFSITPHNDNYHLYLSPYRGKYEGYLRYKNWKDVEVEFALWLTGLKVEITQTDKWQTLDNEIQSLQLYHEENDSFNSKFTVPEYLEIKQRIYQIKEGISQLELLPEQISLLNDKLDMVLDMTTQLGRFDWKSLFVGTIVSIIIQLEVTQDNAKAIWALIKQVFHNYFIGQ